MSLAKLQQRSLRNGSVVQRNFANHMQSQAKSEKQLSSAINRPSRGAMLGMPNQGISFETRGHYDDHNEFKSMIPEPIQVTGGIADLNLLSELGKSAASRSKVRDDDSSNEFTLPSIRHVKGSKKSAASRKLLSTPRESKEP